MRAELRKLSAIDYADLRTLDGQSLETFNVFLDAEIGAVGGAGADIFAFRVRSPLTTEEKCLDGPEFGDKVLVLPSWDYDAVKNAISDVCSRTTGETWPEIGGKLLRFVENWEFQNANGFDDHGNRIETKRCNDQP